MAVIVQVRFAVVDVLVDQTGFDGLQRSVHLIFCCFLVICRFKCNVYTALDINSETNVIQTMYIGMYDIAVLVMDAKNGCYSE